MGNPWPHKNGKSRAHVPTARACGAHPSRVEVLRMGPLGGALPYGPETRSGLIAPKSEGFLLESRELG
jgi:hypothetical protein